MLPPYDAQTALVDGGMTYWGYSVLVLKKLGTELQPEFLDVISFLGEEEDMQVHTATTIAAAITVAALQLAVQCEIGKFLAPNSHRRSDSTSLEP